MLLFKLDCHRFRYPPYTNEKIEKIHKMMKKPSPGAPTLKYCSKFVIFGLGIVTALFATNFGRVCEW